MNCKRWISIAGVLAITPCVMGEDVSTTVPRRQSSRFRDIDVSAMGGLKYDSVTGGTASACVLFHSCRLVGARGSHLDSSCCFHFLILQADAGVGGGKLQLGRGLWYFSGGILKLSLLRTWGETYSIDPNQTYLGVEGQLNILLIHGSIGLYQEIAGDGRNSTLVTFSAGVGF